MEISELDRGDVAIVFDGEIKWLSLEFQPHGPSATRTDGLWWAAAVTPEVIDRVVEIVGRRGLPVETIVIGGLERYPISIDEWMRWFARWSQGPGPSRIVVDTKGLSRRQRHRLINGTRRQIALNDLRDPVAMMAGVVRRWIHGRTR